MTPAAAEGVLFDGTTHCEEELPVGWCTAPPPPAEVLHERNGAMLRLLAQLEEQPREAKEDSSPRDTDLPRLEAKVDLLLELAGSLLALQRPPPPRARLHLSGRGVVWSGAPELAVGQAGRVLLHLHAAVPQPLELPACVLAVEEGAGPRRAWLAFESLPEPVAAQLERYTFRRHRRAIAGLRLARSAG